MFPSSFYRCFSALSHFVTSKDAFAFYSLSSYLKFSIISSLSFIRLRSLFKLEMLLVCWCAFAEFNPVAPLFLGAVLVRSLRPVWSPPRAERVAERELPALSCLC